MNATELLAWLDERGSSQSVAARLLRFLETDTIVQNGVVTDNDSIYAVSFEVRDRNGEITRIDLEME